MDSRQDIDQQPDLVGLPSSQTGPQYSQDDLVNLPAGTSIALPDAVAQNRAMNWDMAMGSRSPGVPAIMDSIQSEDGKSIQQATKANVDHDDFTRRIAAVEQIAKYRNGPVSPEEMDVILGLRADSRGRNLQTIMEQEYAHGIISALGENDMVQNTLAAWNAQYPDGYHDTLDLSTDITAKNQIKQRIIEEKEALYKDQGLASRAFQTGKQFLIPSPFPWSSAWNEKNAAREGNSFFSPINIANQWNDLYSLPPEEFERQLRAGVDKIWAGNPADALEFLYRGSGTPMSDQIVNSAFEVSNLSLLAGLVPKGMLRKLWPNPGTSVRPGTPPPPGLNPEQMAFYKGFRGDVEAILRANQNLGAFATQFSPSRMNIQQIQDVAQGVKDASFYSSLRPRINDILHQGYNSVAAEGARGMTMDELQRVNSAAVLSAGVNPDRALVVFGRRQLEDMARNLESYISGLPKASTIRLEEISEGQYKGQALFNGEAAAPNTHYYMVHDNGHPSAMVSVSISGNSATVNNIMAVEEGRVGNRTFINPFPQETANSLGPAKTREVLRQFLRQHPEVTYIGGNRHTGARPVPTEMGISVKHDLARGEPATIGTPSTFEAKNQRTISRAELMRDRDSLYKVDPVINRGLADIKAKLVHSSDERPNTSYEIIREHSPQQMRATYESGVRPMQDATVAAHPMPEDGVLKAKPDTILEAAGDLNGAAQLKAMDDVRQGLNDISTPSRSMAEYLDGLTKFFFPGEKRTAGASTKLAMEMTNHFMQTASDLGSALFDHAKIQRISDEALKYGFTKTKERIQKSFPHAQVLDWIPNFGIDRNNITNVNSMTAKIGKRDLTLFDDWDKAATYARLQMKLANGKYEIGQDGAGFFIKITRPVDETDPTLQILSLGGNNAPPMNITNMLYGSLRSSKDVLSKQNNQARGIATHTQQVIQQKIKEAAKEIGVMSKSERKEMLAFHDRDRTFIRPDGFPGRYFDNPGDMASEFFQQFGHQPSDKQQMAYFTNRMLNDFHYVAKNLGFNRDMSRMNATVWTSRMFLPETAEAEAKAIKTEEFYGRQVDTLPEHGQYGVWVIDSETKANTYYRRGGNNLKPEDLKEYKDNGYKIIQVVDPVSNAAFKDHVSDYVNYVLTKGGTDRPLNNFEVPYNPGGPINYADQHFLKQPMFSERGGRLNYEGDRTLLSASSQAEIQQWAERHNKAFEIYGRKDTDPNAILELKDYLGKNLPYSLDEFVGNMKSGYWTSEPTMHVHANSTTLEANPSLTQRPRFYNEQMSPSNLMTQVDKSNLGSRDPLLQTIKIQGTEEAPQYVLDTARMLDPYESLSRTMNNVIASRLINDYKALAGNSFISQVIRDDLMNVTPDKLRGNPLYYLLNPDWKITPSNAHLLANAKAGRLAVMNFLNMNNPDIQKVKFFQNYMLNKTFEHLGQGATDFVAEHLISTISDPFKYGRNMAFVSKMGFWNPVQYLNQLQTLVHATAIAGPVNGWHGITGMLFSQSARLTENPTILRAMAEKTAAISGWKVEDLLQAREELTRSGWNLVQGETAFRNDIQDANVVSSTMGKILHNSTFFFREGERVPREAAWYAAFKEWKNANPGRVFTDNDMASVIDRADLMTLNMTRASSAAWEGGPIAGSKLAQLAGQFGTYQIRLLEQLWGGRLTQSEKLRVIAMYSVMYGIPVASGAAIGAWPMYDQFRRDALSEGRNWDNSLTRVLMDGVPAWMIEQATGKKYNFAERFGAQGLTQFSDLWNGEKSMADVIAGVAGSTSIQWAQSMWPVVAGAWYAVIGQSEKYPIVMGDVVNAFRNISSVNSAVRAYYAWNWQKYMSKNGLVIGDADKMDAIAFAAFGLTQRAQADIFRESSSMKIQQEAWDLAEKNIAAEMHQSFIAASQNNQSLADDHIKRAQHLMIAADIPPQNWARIIKMSGASIDLQKKINYDFYINKAPQSQAPARREDYYENH